MNRSSPLLSALLASILAIVSITATACGGEDRPAMTYEMRGIIRQVPVAGQAGSELYIQHEEVPSFVSIDGEETGMDSMTMGFPIADQGQLEGLAVGDKIAFSLVVDWDGSPPLALIRIEKLPPETVLSFEQSTEPKSTEPMASPAADPEADPEAAPEADPEVESGSGSNPDPS